MKRQITLCAITFLISLPIVSPQLWGYDQSHLSEYEKNALVEKLMSELREANKRYKWNPTLFEEKSWKVGGQSVMGRPLIYWECGTNKSNTTLMLSTVHGDEITPVYFGLRLVSWLKGEPDLCRDHRIIVAPIVNPDGFLKKKPERTNANGVDLNRNFPTSDFEAMAHKLWKESHKSHPRRNPGPKGGSEPETQFQSWLIENFEPGKILTIHSPLNFFDYDGPEDDKFKTFAKDYIKSCEELRTSVKKASVDYNFLRYGFFPGSLGNFAGKERGIPTLTLELPTTDHTKAKSYFERLKTGTRVLITYLIKGNKKPEAKSEVSQN
ncbi:MAG: succinylglutamate desuccinylase/aspartoacylase family protein [Oligoflexia bacterium]|nr:succinylglutamate desuccinylase/aspartoacylase family protein [Oligoflexia bacterium]